MQYAELHVNICKYLKKVSNYFNVTCYGSQIQAFVMGHLSTVSPTKCVTSKISDCTERKLCVHIIQKKWSNSFVWTIVIVHTLRPW